METIKHKSGAFVIKCGSAKEMYDVCAPCNQESKGQPKTPYTIEWCGGTLSALKEELFNGNNQLASQAEGLIAKIPEIELPSTYGVEFVRDVFGSKLSVGDYLSGSPTCFRRRRRQECYTAPIKIVVGVSVSARISVEQQQKRGLAVLAFVQLVQASRPVELFVLDEGRDNKNNNMYFLTEVDTKPLNVASASVVLSNVGVSRSLMMEYEQVHHGNSSSWPLNYKSNSKVYDDYRRGVLGLGSEDITIDSLQGKDPFIDDAVGWVKNQLNQLKQRMELNNG